MSKRKHRRRPRNRKQKARKKQGWFARIFHKLALMFFIAIAIGLAKYGTVIWVVRLLIWAFASAAGEVIIEVTQA